MRPRYADLLRRLRDPDPRQVDKAFDAILFDREKAVPDLVEASLQGGHPPEVRYLVVQLLGFSEVAEAAPAVERCLEDPSPLVRAEACRSLADLKARDRLSAIRARLSDVDAEVRRAALEAIGSLARG